MLLARQYYGAGHDEFKCLNEGHISILLEINSFYHIIVS